MRLIHLNFWMMMREIIFKLWHFWLLRRMNTEQKRGGCANKNLSTCKKIFECAKSYKYSLSELQSICQFTLQLLDKCRWKNLSAAAPQTRIKIFQAVSAVCCRIQCLVLKEGVRDGCEKTFRVLPASVKSKINEAPLVAAVVGLLNLQ